MPRSLHNCPTEALGLLVSLWMIGSGGMATEAQYSAYGVEKLGSELLPVVC